MTVMNSEVLEYQNTLIDDPRGYLFGKYLGMLRDPKVPVAPAGVEDVRFWNYMWYRNHYWDRVDFTDSRLVRDGSFHNMIEMWWGQVIPPDPDTLFFEAKKLLAHAAVHAVRTVPRVATPRSSSPGISYRSVVR